MTKTLFYKYFTWDGAVRFLDNRQAFFSSIDLFNDPFEGTILQPPEEAVEEPADHDDAGKAAHPSDHGDAKKVTHFLEGNTDSPTHYQHILRSHFARTYLIFCMTRQPLNSLMWSHYGDSLKGCVVGFDPEKAGFGNDKIFDTTYETGNVIYSATKPTKNRGVSSDQLLHKAAHWYYEEEVRIIAKRDRLASAMKAEEKDKGFLWSLPQNAIKEIYIGDYALRSILEEAANKSVQQFKDYLEGWQREDIKIFQVVPDSSTWDLRQFPEKKGKTPLKEEADNQSPVFERLLLSTFAYDLKYNGGIVKKSLHIFMTIKHLIGMICSQKTISIRNTLS